MKEIPLTQGKVALVDDEYFEDLSKYKWYVIKGVNTFYAIRTTKVNGKRTTIWMHRIIMKTPREMITDHRNGNGLDNRKENLRICTISENQMNKGKQKSNISGYKGVSWHEDTQKWVARISANNKAAYLGIFKTKEDAHKAYYEAAKKYHGEFANIGG